MISEVANPRSKGAAYFRMGTKSPNKRRSIRPPAAKRKLKYKRGITEESVVQNRKRRSSLSQHARERKKKTILEGHRANLIDDANFESLSLSSEKRYIGSAREKLVAFYKDHNPSKICNVDSTMAKYAGKEETLFINLAKRYETSVSVFGVPTTATTLHGDDKTCAGAAKETFVRSISGHVCKNAEGAVFGAGRPYPPFVGHPSDVTFRCLASPKSRSSRFGSGSLRSSSKGRTSVTSLKTFTEDLRLSSDSTDDESIMDCD